MKTLILSILLNTTTPGQFHLPDDNPALLDVLMRGVCAHYCRNTKVCAYEGNNDRSVYWWYLWHRECNRDYREIATDAYLCPNPTDSKWDDWETDCR